MNSYEEKQEAKRQRLQERAEKLKIEKAKKWQGTMKTINRAIKKDDNDAIRALGVSDTTIAKLKAPDFAGRVGFPSYELTNNGANIRRMKKRIAELEAEASREPVEDRTVGDVTISEDDGRLQLIFPGKPERMGSQTQ